MFLDILLACCIILFLLIVLGATEWKGKNPVMSSAIGSITIALIVLKLQTLEYLPAPV